MSTISKTHSPCPECGGTERVEDFGNSFEYIWCANDDCMYRFSGKTFEVDGQGKRKSQ